MPTIAIGNLALDGGNVLEGVGLAYERSGNPDGPVILICHALTGDQYAVGTDEAPGWWSRLAGPGKAVDTDKFQVICFNVLGGCNGSTGPQSINPNTGTPYRSDFPLLTIRDMVRAEYQALKILGIEKVKTVIGGSLGGMKALEWGALYPDFAETIVPLAVNPAFTSYALAFNHISIQAIEHDPDFQKGNYGGSSDFKGFHLARMAGMISYRSGKLFNDRFGRTANGVNFEVESYLDYQGGKLARRFDANSYLILLKAMNSHDVGERKIASPILSISFTHDLLYPAEGMVTWLQFQPEASWEVIETDFGHDGFLVEFEKWGGLIRKFLQKQHQANAAQ
ncbi:homoserine O-acetyltransferase MetX [Planococcus salinarum]|uniref:homoserine O-acetyltransferase MetX n=1 Tax=Planococcus salinarum TaxID=622695 RepID=UPI000E3BC27A|nr:homoserine O-acetyltransferase [Planococcus salinarum]TAA73610.1 homoserine O-acetyltransferase [Planococcus salinarum]